MAASKDLFVDKMSLAKLGVPTTDHDKLPDVGSMMPRGTGCSSSKR